MAKKQTRRTVSFNRSFYERLRDQCKSDGVSMAQFVEARIEPVLAINGRPAPKAGG